MLNQIDSAAYDTLLIAETTIDRALGLEKEDHPVARRSVQSSKPFLNAANPVSVLNTGGSFGKIQSDISGTSGLSAGDQRILQFALLSTSNLAKIR